MTDVCVRVCLSVFEQIGGGAVMMRDFKIEMDGLVNGMTGFQAPCPVK